MTSNTAARREVARHRSTGRFGEQEHSAPELTLGADAEDFDAARARREREAYERDDARELLVQISRTAKRFCGRWGKHSDHGDIVGDSLIQVYTTKANKGMPHMLGGIGIHIANQVAKGYFEPGLHHTDYAGRKKLKAWTDEFIQEHGRFPTSLEITDQAETIRMSFPAGRRPSIGFEHRTQVESIDEHLDDDGDIDDFEPVTPHRSGFSTDTSAAAAAYDAVEESSLKPADARKNIWNLLAADGPKVAVKTLDDDRAHRAAIDTSGGITDVARAWESGDLADDDPASVALFAPFDGGAGTLSQAERGKITSTLLSHTGYADKIWDSAMTAAVDIHRLRALKRRESRQAQRELAAA